MHLFFYSRTLLIGNEWYQEIWAENLDNIFERIKNIKHRELSFIYSEHHSEVL